MTTASTTSAVRPALLAGDEQVELPEEADQRRHADEREQQHDDAPRGRRPALREPAEVLDQRALLGGDEHDRPSTGIA